MRLRRKKRKTAAKAALSEVTQLLRRSPGVVVHLTNLVNEAATRRHEIPDRGPMELAILPHQRGHATKNRFLSPYGAVVLRKDFGKQ